VKAGTRPKDQQKALHRKQRGDHMDGGMTGTQVFGKEKAVETALFIFQFLKMLLVILW
jgi:hypothetical protein